MIGGHHKSHTAGFTRAVFFVAMLLEATPLVIATLVNVLVVEAHFQFCSLRVITQS